VDTAAYIERLYGAFSEAPRPERAEITPHRCEECDEIATRLALHAAWDVPHDDMLWLGDSAMPLLGPRAFRYYLPRFIEFCLLTPRSSAGAVVNYNLAPSGDLDVGERNRFSSFNKAERGVVLEFVEYRASLPESEFDQRYLEDARVFWSIAA